MESQLTIPDHRRQVLVYVNPTAGAWSTKRSIERLTSRLEAYEFRAEIIHSPDGLLRSCEKLTNADDLRAVVSAGGDGTAALVLSYTPPGTPVAVLPQGTENLLSRFLRSPRRPESIARLIAQGRLVRLDGGEANGRLFTLMVSCGFDAEVVRRLSESRRGNISHLSYFKPLVDAVRRYGYPEIRIRPGGSGNGNVLAGKWAIATNIPLYAMGLRFAPEARPNDGMLDVTAFPRGGWYQTTCFYLGMLAGMHPRRLHSKLTAGESFVVESDDPVPYQLDGDPGGMLPVEIRVLPQRLTMVVREEVQQALTAGVAAATEYSP